MPRIPIISVSDIIGYVLSRLLVEPARPAIVRDRSYAPWLAVAAVTIGAFMGQLDASIATVALPRIQADLGVSVGAVEWVSLAYLLTLIATIIAVGRLADRYGRKLFYVYGFGLFALASLGAGLSGSLEMLVLFRVVQGIGAAMLQANSVALIATSLPRHQLGRGIGIQGAAQAVGLTLGPAVGALVVAHWGWQAIFLLNVPVGALGIALGLVFLPRSRGLCRSAIRWLDFLPALPGLLAGLGSYLVLFGVLFVIPFSYHGANTGLVLTALPALIAITAPVAGSLVVRVGGRALTTAGMLLSALGLVFLSLASGAWLTAAALGVVGIGIGAFTPANNAGIMALAPPGQPGMTSGVLNLTRGLGTSAGVALTGAVYTATSGSVPVTVLTLAAVAVVAAVLQGVRRETVVPG